MLLSRGPVGFVKELIAVLHEARAAWDSHRSHHNSASADGVGSEGAPSDRIEERIMALQLQFSWLAEGLSSVRRAAAALRLSSPGSPTPPPSPTHEGNLQYTTLAAVHECLLGLTGALDPLRQQSEQLQQYETAAR
eukprot:GHUV01057672.1.p1 GENE.GHUV01057672.1~~GHUV01057672.1.p1  ORF type:complete len:136 (+),score=36.07 GHUV01057672.1:661-1068(+)